MKKILLALASLLSVLAVLTRWRRRSAAQGLWHEATTPPDLV